MTKEQKTLFMTIKSELVKLHGDAVAVPLSEFETVYKWQKASSDGRTADASALFSEVCRTALYNDFSGAYCVLLELFYDYAKNYKYGLLPWELSYNNGWEYGEETPRGVYAYNLIQKKYCYFTTAAAMRDYCENNRADRAIF